MSSHTTDFPDADSTNPVDRSASLILVKGAAGSRTTENQRVSDVVPKALNTDIDGEADDTKFTTTAKVFRAIARKVRNASTVTFGIVRLARNEDVDSSETDLSRVPTVSAAIRLVRRLLAAIRQVPSAPGTDAGIGRVLTVTGRGDTSYGWRDPAGGGLDQAAVDGRVEALVTDDRILDLAKASRAASDRGLFLGVSTTDENDLVLRAAGGAATDQTARDAAAAAQTTANSKIGRNDLPPFASIYAIPQGIEGRDFPTPFEIFFSERLTAKTITRLVVNAAGSIAQIDATTPLSGISSRARDSGALRFALTSQSIDNIRNAIGANHVATAIQLTFTFDDGTTYLHSIPFPVNNDVFAPPSPRVQTITPTATAVTAQYSAGSAVQLNMNRNVTLNLGGGVRGQSMLVQTVQDGTGSRTLTLNAAIQRDGRAAPVLSTAARARDFLYFYRDAASWVYLGIIKAA